MPRNIERGSYWSGVAFGFTLGVLYMAILDLITK